MATSNQIVGVDILGNSGCSQSGPPILRVFPLYRPEGYNPETLASVISIMLYDAFQRFRCRPELVLLPAGTILLAPLRTTLQAWRGRESAALDLALAHAKSSLREIQSEVPVVLGLDAHVEIEGAGSRLRFLERGLQLAVVVANGKVRSGALKVLASPAERSRLGVALGDDGIPTAKAFQRSRMGQVGAGPFLLIEEELSLFNPRSQATARRGTSGWCKRMGLQARKALRDGIPSLAAGLFHVLPMGTKVKRIPRSYRRALQTLSEAGHPAIGVSAVEWRGNRDDLARYREPLYFGGRVFDYFIG